MRNLEKYEGVIPAFYACYDENGNISEQGEIGRASCRERV